MRIVRYKVRRENMGLFGDLLKGTGNVAGGVAKYAVKGSSHLIGGIADVAGAYDFADKARDIGDATGEFLHTAGKFTGKIAGTTADFVIDTSTEVCGGVTGGIAELAGADEETIQKAKVIGKLAGGAIAGLGVGSVAGIAVTGITAATGVASTGVAISTLHGAAQTSATMAAIGGGALSAGGAGIAGGQAVLTGISVATTATGALHGGIKSADVRDDDLDSNR